MPLKNGRQSSDLQTILVGSVIPSGTIAPFGGGTVPAGWMLCNGSAISRTTYSALFSAVNTTYGVGDGASTFNLPNAQGVFLRGAGSQTISGTFYSTTRGNSQQDALQNITGDLIVGSSSATSQTGAFLGTSSGSPDPQGTGRARANINFDASRVARTSTETRPANIGVNYIIKL